MFGNTVSMQLFYIIYVDIYVESVTSHIRIGVVSCPGRQSNLQSWVTFQIRQHYIIYTGIIHKQLYIMYTTQGCVILVFLNFSVVKFKIIFLFSLKIMHLLWNLSEMEWTDILTVLSFFAFYFLLLVPPLRILLLSNE